MGVYPYLPVASGDKGAMVNFGGMSKKFTIKL